MSDIENLRGKAVKDTWENILRFNNANQGISNTVQSIYDGAGNPLPIKVSRTRIEISNTIISNASITANISIVSPAISGGTMYSSTNESTAVIASDSNIPLKNLNLTSYVRDKFLHNVQYISNTGLSKLTIDPNVGKFFIVDRTGEPDMDDIEILAMSNVFNSSFSSSGYTEIFVYLHAADTAISVPLDYRTTTVYWHSPVSNQTPQNLSGISTGGSCLFTLQTFDRGATWCGKVLAMDLSSPV